MDARVKVVFTLAFIVALSLAPHGAWPAYILFLTLVLSATLFSRLPVSFVLKRALLAIPFVLAALPLVFSGPPPRYPLILTNIAIPLYYSPAGVVRFASITIKSWISLQAAIWLASTTQFPDLLAALRQLGVPALFTAIVGLMWRYLFVIGDETIRMLRARSSRSAAMPGSRPGGTLFWRARVTGGMAGSLFLRSLERSDRVYAAMLSRGYNGEPPGLNRAPLSPSDRKFLVFGVAILLALLWIGLLTGG